MNAPNGSPDADAMVTRRALHQSSFWNSLLPGAKFPDILLPSTKKYILYLGQTSLLTLSMFIFRGVHDVL